MNDPLPTNDPSPSPTTPAQTAPDQKPVDPKLGKLKSAILYVLIGGLVTSALISIIAILIGEFNSVITKALLTTFVFVTHSLIILALVSADRNNSIGKAIIPSTIFVAIIANMFTTTLGTWNIIDGDVTWRAFLLYVLAVGSSFIVAGALRLRIANKATNAAVYTTAGSAIALTLILIPWVAAPDAEWLGPLYYRLVAVLAILGATAFSLSVIFNRIAVAANQALRQKVQPKTTAVGGMLAIYVVTGFIVGTVWLYGAVALIGSAASSDEPTYRYEESRQPY